MHDGFVLPGGVANRRLQLSETAGRLDGDGVFAWEAPHGVDAWALPGAMAAYTGPAPLAAGRPR